MSVVKAQQPGALGIMQRERVMQAVRTLRRCLGTLDLELQPEALFEVMNAGIERQQEFQRVFVV